MMHRGISQPPVALRPQTSAAAAPTQNKDPAIVVVHACMQMHVCSLLLAILALCRRWRPSQAPAAVCDLERVRPQATAPCIA
jgi:hypothetical protein